MPSSDRSLPTETSADPTPDAPAPTFTSVDPEIDRTVIVSVPLPVLTTTEPAIVPRMSRVFLKAAVAMRIDSRPVKATVAARWSPSSVL